MHSCSAIAETGVYIEAILTPCNIFNHRNLDKRKLIVYLSNIYSVKLLTTLNVTALNYTMIARQMVGPDIFMKRRVVFRK